MNLTNFSNVLTSKIIVGGLVIFWCALYVMGIVKYSGSALLYTFFSFVYLALIISGFIKQTSYGYTFLSTMLWLGFFGKLTAHLCLGFTFVEPVGYFQSSQASWDQVLLVATLGGGGILTSRLIYALLCRQSSMLADEAHIFVPDWYSVIRRGLWVCLMTSCLVIALVNAVFGIQQAGLVPRTILFFPMNALIYWLLSYGLALAVASLLWWDVCQQRKLSWVIYAVLVEGVISSISILSRATYVFHVVPQLAALLKNRGKVISFSAKHILLLSVICIVLLFVSLRGVNLLRGHYYSGEETGIEDFYRVKISSSSVLNASQFLIGRWVGVEGVMAIVDYPKKGSELFFRQLTERPIDGKVLAYQEISLAHYRFMDLSKFRFTSLPGPISFLYSSGSLLVVFFGMLILGILVMVSEYIIFRLTYNPIVVALWGGMAANAVAQMGVAPAGLIKYLSMMAGGVVAIYIVQSKIFSAWIFFVKNHLKKGLFGR